MDIIDKIDSVLEGGEIKAKTKTMKKLEKLTGMNGDFDGYTFKLTVGNTTLEIQGDNKHVNLLTRGGDFVSGFDNPTRAYKYLKQSGDLK